MGSRRKVSTMTQFLFGVLFAVIFIGYILAFCRIAYLNELESERLKGENE
jgi:hypothetical protein